MRTSAQLMLFLFLLCSCLIPAASSWAVPVLSLDLDDSGSMISAGTGQTVSIEVLASGIPAGSDGLGLFGYGFRLSFDALLTSDGRADSLTLGALWSGTGFDGSRNDPGDVGLTSNRFFEAAGPDGDSILLGTLVITTGSTPGVYALGLGHFTGAGDNTLFDFTILDDNASFFGSGGTITVAPEPASAHLALVCLGLVAGFRRRLS